MIDYDDYFGGLTREEYEEQTKEHFEWLGFIKNPHKIVKQCDYSVLLSDDETWGLVLTEAMLLGVPCIATDFDVVFEQITDKNLIVRVKYWMGGKWVYTPDGVVKANTTNGKENQLKLSSVV